MNVVAALVHEVERHRRLVERAIQELSDEEFLRRPGEQVNSVALVIKHLAGNLSSRWYDFLTTDGEKPTRDRDSEFVIAEIDTRANLMADWQLAWRIVDGALAGLTDQDLSRTVTIRGEPHTVLQALARSVSHVAYHTGQILYITRLLKPDAPWLSIAPGKSREHGTGGYLRSP